MVGATCLLLFGVLLFLTSSVNATANKTLSNYNNLINVTTTFTLNDSLPQFPSFTDGSTVRPILISRASSDNSIKFGCGFYCRGGNCTHYLFSVFILVHDKHLQPLVYAPPQLVWSANPKHPVKEGAMLVPDPQNGWILQDFDKTLVWNTPNLKSISVLMLKDSGNLVLYNADHSPIWESFSYPSDSLLPGQNLTQGTANKLIPISPFTDRNVPSNSYYLQVTKEGVFTYVDSNPPTLYYSYLVKPDKKPVKNEPPLSYIRFLNGSLACFILSAEPNEPDFAFGIPRASSVQYLKLMPDGRFIVFEWNLQEWTQVGDILMSPRGKCGQPMACGKNSVCSASQQCDCVGSQYFRPNNYLQNNLGCYSLTPLLCNDTKSQTLISEKNVQHLIFTTHMESVDMPTCKQACLRKCPCKAAIFRHSSDSSNGSCYLPTELFTLLKVNPVENNHKDETFIKIQITPVFHWKFAERSHPQRWRLPVMIIIVICVGAVVGFGFIFSFIKYLKEKRHNQQLYQALERYDDRRYIRNVPGLPTWYSYQQLQTATNDFSENNLIGKGGQASCFRGTLDDYEIAVKKFERSVDFNESFQSEIRAIATLHHVNVLKLIGYCPLLEGPLLVYEYMGNGSLNKWIKRDATQLTWSTWKRIITQIAKGLAYLNEECNSQGILHFDLKPENVLLDTDFSVKICDFGLSRFISTSQRQNKSEKVHPVTVKGTRRYMAPERIHGEIKTTADVYSFGMIVLEICGREQIHEKLGLEDKLRKFISTGNTDDLIDIIGKKHENRKEAGELLRLAARCLEFKHEKRPSMLDVCKYLDDGISVPTHLSSMCAPSTSEASTSGTKPVKASSFEIEHEN